MSEKWSPGREETAVYNGKNRITVKVGPREAQRQEYDQQQQSILSSESMQGEAVKAAGAERQAATDAPVPVRVAPGTYGRPSFRKRRGGRGAALAAGLAALAVLAVLLPALLTQRAGPQPAPSAEPAAQLQQPAAPGAAAGANERLLPAEDEPQPKVRVYLSRTGAVETVPLEQYVTGVLAAEMPADFELEALKAQAIAARTFIVRRLAAGDTSGIPGGKADVLDTVDHQVYLSGQTLAKWAEEGKSGQLSKLERAVRETRGIVMTYQGKPITAAFFSSSGGYTENSEEYWSLSIPYLRSVPSPWEDNINPKNKETLTLSINEVFSKVGQKLQATPVSAQGGAKRAGENGNEVFRILSKTTGGRVKEIQIGNRKYTGREIREKLGLRSSQFTFERDGDNVKITTYGFGHGVGMSQWGANGMAQQGYTTTQILKHYYTGISFQQASKILKL